MDGGSSNNTAHHNLIYNIGQDAAFRLNEPSDGGRYVYNNTTYNCPDQLIKYLGNPNYTEGNNLHNQPASTFVDASTKNFHLAAGSSAIDTGNAYSPWTDGYTGSAPDKGCYEYNGPDSLANWTAGVTAGGMPPPTPIPTPVPQFVE